MSFLRLTEQAELHRAAYVAVLNRHLRERGAKRALAARAGITPQYLSYLTVLDDQMDELREERRTPGLAVIRRIADALPLPREEREFLAMHMELASTRRLAAAQAAISERQERAPGEVLIEVQAARAAANAALDVTSANAQSRAVREGTGLWLSRLDLTRYPSDPRSIIELCLLRNEVQCVLDRPDDALWHAMVARALVDRLLERRDTMPEEDLHDLTVQTICAESLAYHNMCLDRNSYTLYEEATARQAELPGTQRWEAHIALGMMKSLTHFSRFSLREVETLARRAENAYERRAGVVDDIAVEAFMAQENLARAYLQYPSEQAMEKAGLILCTNLDVMGTLPHLGPLRRVMFLRTYARWHRRREDHEGAQETVAAARAIAVSSGLMHQLHQMEREFGPPDLDTP